MFPVMTLLPQAMYIWHPKKLVHSNRKGWKREVSKIHGTVPQIHSYASFCWDHAHVGQPNFFLENWDKLHGRRLAKSWLDTNFQPARTSFDHASEAPKVLKAARISPTWGPSELRRRGQTMSEEAENWWTATIWPNIDREVCPSFPKKNWAGLLHIWSKYWY